MKVSRVNLTLKFIGYFLFLSIIPLLVVGLVTYKISTNVLKDESRRSTTQLVSNQAEYLGLQLKQLSSLIANVSNVEEIRNVLNASASGQSNAYNNLSTQARIGYILNGFINLTGLVSIDIFALDGQHYHVGDTLDVENIRDDVKAYVMYAATQSSDPVTWIGAIDNINTNSSYKKVLAVGRALYRIDPKTLAQDPSGLILVNYSIQELYDHFNKIDFGNGGYMVVIDNEGRLVYHPDQSQIGKPADTTLRSAIIGSSGTAQDLSVDQVDMSVSFATSEISGWKIVGLVPLNTINAKASGIGTTIFLVLVASLGVAVLVAGLLHRDVVMPIRDITERFKQLGTVPANRQLHMPVRGGDEIADLAGWFNTFVDSLEVKTRTEEALHNSEEKLRRITDNMLDIIWQVSLDGIIEYASPSCTMALGYQPEELVGKSVLTRVFPADVALSLTPLPVSGRVEYRYQHANGTYLWLETLSKRLYDERGEAIGLIYASREITQRKQAEYELQQLNILKTEFLSTAAHELRTPLVSIQGFSELMLTRQLDASRQLRFLTLINEQAVQLGSLINDLLDISRLEAKRALTLNMETLDLSELFGKIVAPFAESSTKHHFHIDGFEGCPPITGDGFRLTQVGKNLLSNAVKYSPSGGNITVHGECRANDMFEISVHDEGMGMTEDQLAHLFEKFYRADTSNTSISGTGLGLAISKLIVELHGGQIWAESKYGKGTSFHFTLPLKANLPEPAPAESEPQEPVVVPA